LSNIRSALLASLASLLCAAASASEPVRIVSLNVCADQLLLELADREQIVALTHLSMDSEASYNHALATDIPQTQSSAEEVLALNPSLVIAGSYGQKHTIALLRKQGVHVEQMPIAQNLEGVLDNIRLMGTWLGKEQQSAQLVDSLQQRIDNLPAPGESRPLAAKFEANGYTVGASTLTGQMLDLAGFENIATHIGITHYGKITLESLLLRAPEVLIDSPYAEGAYSRAQALPKHPALRRSKLAPDVIRLLVNTTICAGPWTIDNLETLAQKRLDMQENSK